MKRIAILLTLLISTFHFSVVAQDMTLSKDSFEGNFVIDSTFTRDGGKTFEVSASGDAGPYGRAYLSYVFTDKQNLGTAGEFTGFACRIKGVHFEDFALFYIGALKSSCDDIFSILCPCKASKLPSCT